MVRNSSIFNSEKIPYGLLWMAFFFLFTETCLRMFWHPHIIGQRLYARFEGAYSYGFDEKQRIWHKTGDRIYFYPTQYINFHCQSIPAVKNDNTFRAFTFGGSVSRAKATANYSYYLQENLNAENPVRHWTVTNLSADGIGSARMLLLLKKILPLKPDLIILHLHGSNEFEDERDDAYRNELHAGFNGVILQSRLLVLLKKIYAYISSTENTAISDAEDELTANRNPSNQVRWLKTIDRNLSKMLERCVQSNIPVILVGRAEKLEGIRGFASMRTGQVNDILKKNTSSEITYFDTADKFLKTYPQTQGKNLLFSDETHWTEYGHRVIAHELQKHLHRLASPISKD